MNYDGKDNYGKPKQNYLDKIGAMQDTELFDETKHKIWLSAYAANNPRSDYHWQCDATFHEWRKRDKTNEYVRAHEEVSEAL